jgi:Uma2 family endonuclease
MNPLTQTVPERPLSPREQRLEELIRRVQAPGGSTDLEAMLELTELLPEEDDEPLETPWHYAAIGLLKLVFYHCWQDRDDFYIGGNMFVYYNIHHLPRPQFRGPDFFYVSGTPRRKYRGKWVVWEEGLFPDLIIEFLSPSTAAVDRTTKKDLYARDWKVGEYFCYEPDLGELEGWRLDPVKGYQPIPTDDRGWMWSGKLGMWLGKWTGEFEDVEATWLRPYDAEGNLLLYAGEEAALRAEAEHKRAEDEHRRAEDEHKRAEDEHKRAEAARQEAERERKRAETAEEELARLRARLAELETRPGHGPS